jgi:hypothetical protein
VASKHWVCLHAVERQGRFILTVDSGHLRDMTMEMVFRLSSAAFIRTASY